MESDQSSPDDTHAPRWDWRSRVLRPLTAPVLLLAAALGLFLAGGATATGLSIASDRPADRCESWAEDKSDGLDLRGADLSGAMLAGAELCGANLRGAILENACLRGVRINGSDLTGAVLTGADLTGAETDGVVGLPEDLPQSKAACE
jgi:hypothetical protein